MLCCTTTNGSIITHISNDGWIRFAKGHAAIIGKHESCMYDTEGVPRASCRRRCACVLFNKTPQGDGDPLLFGCVTWTLGSEHFAELRTAYHKNSSHVRTDRWFPAPTMHHDDLSSCMYVCRTPRGHGTMQCEESVKTTIRVIFAGAVAADQLLLAADSHPSGNIWGDGCGGENPRPGRPENNPAQCLAHDLREFQATEGSTEKAALRCSQ